jgi:hypothetical protein
MARTFVECGSSKVAIIDLNEADAKTAAQDMESWFGKFPYLSPPHPPSTIGGGRKLTFRVWRREQSSMARPPRERSRLSGMAAMLATRRG